MTRWSVDRINDRALRLLDPGGLHVGNLKCIGGAWKFKAIGYDASGSVIPGGGALTDRHNTVFASLDVEHIGKVLGSVPDAGSSSTNHTASAHASCSNAGVLPPD